MRGYLAESKADYQSAVVAYKRAVELAPDYSYLHLALGNAYRAQKSYDEALKAYSRASALDPKDAHEMLRYAVRRGLIRSDEGDRVAAEIDAAAKAAKSAARAAVRAANAAGRKSAKKASAKKRAAPKAAHRPKSKTKKK